MQVSPSVALWVKLVLTVLNLIASGGISFAGLVSPQTAVAIGGGSQVAITLIGALMTAFSSSTPGPLAPADPPVVQAATKLANAATVGEVIAAKTELNTETAKH